MRLDLDETSKIDTSDTNSIGINDSNIINSNKLMTEEAFDNIDLKIERDELVATSDFPHVSNKINNKQKFKSFGNTYVFLLDKKGNPLIVIGPHCNNNFDSLRFYVLLNFEHFKIF